MKDLEKIADELIECYWTEVEEIINDECVKMTFNMAVQCAIQSVNHAINCLEAVIQHDKERYGITRTGVSMQLDEQLELKKILEQKSRI
jgi:hypothetical protein